MDYWEIWGDGFHTAIVVVASAAWAYYLWRE
jgi:hypothetical protein